MNDRYHDMVILLSRGISQRKMYFQDHPRVLACAREFTELLVTQLDADERGKFFIGVANGKLIHEGKYLIGPSIIGSRLNGFARLTGSGGFLFDRNVTTAELGEFFALAAGQTTPLAGYVEARELFKSRNIHAIELSPPYEDPGWFGQFLFESEDNGGNGQLQDLDGDNLLPTFQALFSTVEDAHNAGKSGRGIDLDDTRHTSELLMKATEGQVQDILQVIRYPDYDTYTVGHSVRVAMFAVMVGRHLQLPGSLLNELGVSALLHDVGKSRIPQEILYKPGRLDERERATMEEHPRLGAEMLLESRNNSDLSIAAAWGHHRRYDGKGYPRMDFPIQEGAFARIINVCDVYEALTAIRPYKNSLTGRRALEIMLSDEGWFCPGALTAFVEAVGLYPAGTMVVLSDGCRAQVLDQTRALDRPLTKLTHGPDGRVLPVAGQVELDLSAEPAGRSVREQLIPV